jgi:hypothetical protein
MAELKVGDKIEIIYHPNSAYTGKKGKVMFIGGNLKHGTNPLENDFTNPDKNLRLIVTLDDSTVLNDIQETQVRRV